MKRILALALATAGLFTLNGWGQTDGTASFRAVLSDYNGSGTRHWTVVWVTTATGTFIKTLWKQGPSISLSHWSSHCATWYNAKAGSTALDGYSSATAADYGGTNSPVILSWNCRDASSNLVADGPYKFWLQYAEDSGQGPHTTNGLTWVKGPAGITNTYGSFGTLIQSPTVAWVPAPPPAPPTIANLQVVGGNQLVMSGQGPASRPYYLLVSTDASRPTAQWTRIATNSFSSTGTFSITNPINPSLLQTYHVIQVP